VLRVAVGRARGVDDGVGRAALAALLAEARPLAGGDGLPMHLVVLRLEQGRPEDDDARDWVDDFVIEAEPAGRPHRPSTMSATGARPARRRTPGKGAPAGRASGADGRGMDASSLADGQLFLVLLSCAVIAAVVALFPTRRN
jgi:hypothetical protein